ncbi:MAG: phosphoglycerate kinase [Candidatus Paceibacterota bacterium]
MRSILEIKNLRGRTALVRVDFNVPIGPDGTVGENEGTRIEKALDTIKHLSTMGAKVVLISHIGRDPKESLAPVAEYLKKFIAVTFVPVLYGEEVLGIAENLSEGQIILLENLRSNEGEEKNTEEFAAYLASLADLYVNEAFSVSHREHASVVGVTKFLPSYAGIWFQKEVESLKKMDEPEKPFLFILGGAKFETKVPLIEKFSKIADNIFIGGALANNFMKKIGFETGKSLLDESVNVAKFFDRPNIKIPFDVIVKTGEAKSPNSLSKEDIIVDMGPETLEDLKETIKGAKTILWNGPLGLYEEGFDLSSREILKTISEMNVFSVVGGGDTVALVKKTGLEKSISFISTGGGAMLDFLSSGTLPGIEALNMSENQN